MTKKDLNTPAPEPDEHGHEPGHEHGHEHHEDDLILVPKGRSKRQFLFTLGLMIFVLVIFTVGSNFQSTMGGLFGGGGRNPIYLTWTDPMSGVKHEVHREDFDARFRVLRDFSYTGMFSSMHGDAERSARPQVKAEDAALMLILERLALDHDVGVSDEEFRDFLVRNFQNGDGVKAAAAYVRMPVPYFETEARRLLRCFKVLTVLQSGALIAADSARVEEAWDEGHQQYRFEYLAVSPEDFVDAAKAELPDDAALAEWFHSRPQWEQEKLFHEAKFTLQAAWLPLEAGWDAAKLAERFPAAEGVDPEIQAQNYHRLYSNTRFKLPEPEDGSAPEKLYEDFETVADVCRVEAPIQAALTNWLSDMRKRKAAAEGEPVDFLAEAADLGLETATSEPVTKSDVETIEGWGGTNVAARLFRGMQAETFVSTPIVEKDAMVILWIAGITPPEEPPFDEIRDAVADDWATEHSKELATQRLEGLRDQFGTRPVGGDDEVWTPTATAEQFAAAAASLDLSVHERPYLERNERQFEPVPPGEESEDDAEQKVARAFDEFLAFFGAGLYEVEPGQVGAAQSDIQGQRVFLARLAEKRTRPFSDVKAKDLFGSLRSAAMQSAFQDFREQVMRVDSDWFKRTFQVSLDQWNRKDQNQDEELPAEE